MVLKRFCFSPSSLAQTVISRFTHILSAQGVEGILTTLFFLFLAWSDTSLYGEVMYGIALGSVVGTIVEFGLYHSIVGELSKAERGEVPDIISRVIFTKIGLLIPTLVGVWCLSVFGGQSNQMTWVVFFVCLGFALEAVAETFFADLRVRGRQDKEARIRMVSVILGYGFGFISVATGCPPVTAGLYLVIVGFSQLLLGGLSYVKVYTKPFRQLRWATVGQVLMTASAFALINGLGNLYNQTNVFFLERVKGVQEVAYYSAGLSIVDPVSKIVSRFFLGLVLFPLLSILWVNNKGQAKHLILRTSQWLMVFAFPIMFILHFGSELIMGLIYPEEMKDAIWIQQYLVWAIPFAFGSNLFSFVMIVAESVRVLLFFSMVVTLVNLVFNVVLVPTLGIAGGCLVLIMTKAIMLLLTLFFCLKRLQVLRLSQLCFPLCLSLVCLGLFFPFRFLVGQYPAMAAILLVYGLLLWKPGMRFIGKPPQPDEYDEAKTVS